MLLLPWFLDDLDSKFTSSQCCVDLTIFDNNTLWLTVSNAVVWSAATQTVRCGGFLWLKPVAISLVSQKW